MSTTIYYPATTRFQTDRGWVKGKHSFSFGPYFDESRKAFGPLIILNEDLVIAGAGFAAHPHSNMEIISIPLSGSIKHKDDTGKEAIIHTGEIQIMSAGTGIHHSESNPSQQGELRFLQIWIKPKILDVAPRYQQIALKNEPDQLTQVVSPDPDGDGLWIHQDAWLHMGSFANATKTNYSLKKKGNGMYILLLNGEVKVQEQLLQLGDAISLTETDEVILSILEPSQILIIEVPEEV